MTIKELREILTFYPDDMEVVLYHPACEDYEEYFETDFYVEITDTGQLVID